MPARPATATSPRACSSSSINRTWRVPHQRCGSARRHQVRLQVAREQRPVALELAQHRPPEARVRLQEVARPRVARRAPPPHARADERQVLDRPDERVPLEELALLPDQPVELGDVERAEAAVENEVLRRRDRRDRIHLQEAEAAHDVEHVRRAAVERLRAHRDPPRLSKARPMRQSSAGPGGRCSSGARPTRSSRRPRAGMNENQLIVRWPPSWSP